MAQAFLDLMLPTRPGDRLVADFVLEGLSIAGARLDYQFADAQRRCLVSFGNAGDIAGETLPGGNVVVVATCDPPAATTSALLRAAVARLTDDGRLGALCGQAGPSGPGRAPPGPGAPGEQDGTTGAVAPPPAQAVMSAALEDRARDPLSGWVGLALALVALLLAAPTAVRIAREAKPLRTRGLAALVALVLAGIALTWSPGPGAIEPPPLPMLPLAALFLVILAATLVAAGASRPEALVVTALYGLSPLFDPLLRTEPRLVFALLLALLVVQASIAADRDRTARGRLALELGGVALAGVACGLLAGRLVPAVGWGLFVAGRWLVERRRPARRPGSRLGTLAIVACGLVVLDWIAFTLALRAGWVGEPVGLPPIRPDGLRDGIGLAAPWLSHPLLAVLLVLGLGRLLDLRAWRASAAVLVALVPGLVAWVAAPSNALGSPPTGGFVWGTGVALLAAAPAVRMVADGIPSPRARLALAAGAAALVVHGQLLAKLFFDRWMFPM